MDILIIEDEAKTAKELRNLVEAIRPDIRVISILPSIKSALAWFKANASPQLILSDIELADGLSFEIFRQIPLQAPVIFCTAFDEYAIQAFESNGIDYLLKPVDEEKLRLSIHKYENLKKLLGMSHLGYEGKLENLFSQLKPEHKTSLLVHYQGKIIPIKTEEIAFAHSENGITGLCTLQQKKYNVPYSMDELEAKLSPKQFFRANRQFILNRDVIVNIEHYFTRRLAVHIKVSVPEPIIVSKGKATDFLQWLES